MSLSEGALDHFILENSHHMNKRQEVGIMKVHHGERDLVQKRYSYIVECPQTQPKTAEDVREK
jgi:hypothetical protein